MRQYIVLMSCPVLFWGNIGVGTGTTTIITSNAPGCGCTGNKGFWWADNDFTSHPPRYAYDNGEDYGLCLRKSFSNVCIKEPPRPVVAQFAIILAIPISLQATGATRGITNRTPNCRTWCAYSPLELRLPIITHIHIHKRARAHAHTHTHTHTKTMSRYCVHL